MIMLIVIAAFFLNFVMVSIGLIKAVTDLVLSLGWPPLGMMLAIVGFYLVLGCFMETLSMMIATTPVVVPVVTALGYSPIWWGIVFVILMEAALITPPVGLNLYVVQAVRGRGKFADLCFGALPFVAMMLMMIFLLIAFPQLALWLPGASATANSQPPADQEVYSMRLAALLAAAALALPAAAQPNPPLPATQFNVVGTIGNLSMYQNREVPFWNERIPQVSGGAIRVQAKPFTEVGFRGPEIFRLVSQGTLQFASTVLNYNSGEVPMNEAADLVGLFGSVEELRAGPTASAPSSRNSWRTRHGINLLGFGTYQAQVIYCRDAFTQVADLRGRKVRASGASQQAFVTFLGGSPVTIAFAEVQPALASGVVDCAITGALSGFRSRWHEAAKFISPMPVNFGLVAHLANLAWWNTLDPHVQALLETMSGTSRTRSSSRPGRKPRPGLPATPAAPPARRRRPPTCTWLP